MFMVGFGKPCFDRFHFGVSRTNLTVREGQEQGESVGEMVTYLILSSKGRVTAVARGFPLSNTTIPSAILLMSHNLDTIYRIHHHQGVACCKNCRTLAPFAAP